MANEEKNLKDLVPERLRTIYQSIKKTNTVSTGKLDMEEIELIQNLINDAQPKTTEEQTMRKMVQFFYRRDPLQFYKFIMKTRLYHILLWTEAKRLSLHFKLHNLIYIQWTGEEYVCSKHAKYDPDMPRPSFYKKKVVTFAKKILHPNLPHVVQQSIAV